METEGRVLGAFVDVLAVVAVPRKTGVTHTPWFRCWFCDLQDMYHNCSRQPETSVNVDALGILITASIVFETFVDVLGSQS